MLPDYPIFKKALEEALTERFRKISKESDFVVAEIREVRIHEGQSSILIREDGTKDNLEMRRLSEEMSWKYDDILKLTLRDVMDQIDQAARAMAMKKAKMTFEEIERAVRKVGNEVSTQGEQFSPKHFFEILRRIQMVFDEHNNPVYPTIVAGSEAYEGFKRVMKEIEENPTLQKEYLDLIEKKRLEWRDREAARTLVG